VLCGDGAGVHGVSLLRAASGQPSLRLGWSGGGTRRAAVLPGDARGALGLVPGK
jgi:hypothetical protein